MCSFATLPPPPVFESWFAGSVMSRKKQYPVLFDKQMKGYREEDAIRNAWNAGAKDLKFIESCKSNLI